MSREGDWIGPYQLIRMLGRGGMGTVYRAHQPSLKRDVALKVIRPDLLAQPEHAERFRREVLALARLSHPSVVKVFESGQHEGIAWYAMELLPGASLAELLRPGTPLPLARVRAVSEGLLGALAYLHEQGFLHRDIKPSNVQVPEGAPVKLMDFGLVKDVAGTLVTEEGTTLGTPRYMAPEVLAGLNASVSSDLYQFGVMLYQMLTGQLPIDASNLGELLERVRAGRITPLRAVRPDLPEALEVLVHGLLDPTPDRRPRPATAVWQQLSAALAEASMTTGLSMPAAPERRQITSKVREAPKPSGAEPSTRGARRSHRSTPSLAALGAKGAVAAVSAGVVLGFAMVGALRVSHRSGEVAAPRASAAASGTPAAAALLADDLPLDRWPPSSVPGGLALAAEALPGRRVGLPRGLAGDARGRLFVGSAEGLSWLDAGRWLSREVVPAPASLAVLCADAREGVWARVRLEGTEEWLVRLDETGVRERLAMPPGAGRTSAVVTADGELLVATSGRPLSRAPGGALHELATPGAGGPIAGFFTSGARTGAWSDERVFLREAAGWRAVQLPGGPPGRIRGAALAGDRLWVCGERGALAIEKGSAQRVLEDRSLSGALELPDAVLLWGASGLFRQPRASGTPSPLAIPGLEQTGVAAACAARPGELWALTTTPPALVRVTAAGVTVDAPPAADPDAARAEQAAAPTLWSMAGACIPYAWADAATLAAGRRGQLWRIPAGSPGPLAPLTPLDDSVWPMDLWLPAPGKPLFMVWQKEGTSFRFLDSIDVATGARHRVDGVPEHVDGPIRVSPDGTTIYQGPFIPIVQLLEQGLYVRYHGERPEIGDIQGLRDPVLQYWRPADRTSGRLALPDDYRGGALTFDPARRAAVYVSRDGLVLRRTLPGSAEHIAFPPGVDERAVSELELSPDGALLAFVLQPRASGRTSLHVLDLARRESRRVGAYLYDYAQPRWSPDGRLLAFVRRGLDLSDAQLAVRAVRR